MALACYVTLLIENFDMIASFGSKPLCHYFIPCTWYYQYCIELKEAEHFDRGLDLTRTVTTATRFWAERVVCSIE